MSARTHPCGRATASALCGGLMAALVLAAAPADAQYFGRNKVQYRSFDFQVLETESFDIYYYPEEERAVRTAARLAERWNERLTRVLDYRFPDRQPLILYASPPHFRQTEVIPSRIGDTTGGVTESLKRRVVMPFGGSLAATDHVLGHELVHAFQYALADQGGLQRGGAPLPLWFVEGMAEYLSRGAVDPHTAMWMRDAVEHEDLPKVSELSSPQYFPYRWGHALWSYIAGRWGDPMVARVLRAASPRGATARAALEAGLEIDLETLSNDWHDALRDAYAEMAREQRAPTANARRLISSEGTGGTLNVGPALSPDGERVAFISERDLFSVELYYADAETGEVIARLSETATDPHFDSLQFVDSSGAWSPDGERFAVTAVSAGRALLTIYDAEGERVEEHRLPDVDVAYNPSWSPDGKAVVLAGMSGGFLDLWTYELASRELERLTDDPWAELHPAWSPDGERIAFATDRFTTDLETLEPGPYRLALLDLGDGSVRALPGFAGAKHIDPQWDGDERLYFLSDRGGVTDVYRLDLDPGRLYQVTGLYTGVSGIAAESPALSVAAEGGRLVYSAYEDGEHRLYVVDERRRLQARQVSGPADSRRAAALPPLVREEPEIGPLQRQAEVGLPGPIEAEARPYEPSLSLDYVSQPSIGIGVDRFGTYAGGGSALYFSDMLGHHRLGAQLQVNGRLRDFALVGNYENRSSRLDWGGFVQHVPYQSLGFRTSVGQLDGRAVVLEDTLRFRQIERGGGGVVSYPLSSATRVEASAGYRNIAFDNEIERIGVALDTGEVVVDDTIDLPATEDAHLLTASAALVHDTSLFGATSPILGERARFEVSPQVGSIDYTSLLADYRRYWIPFRPVTLAFRLMHYGRYGGGAEDGRLAPLYIGYPSLVRGYSIGSFDAGECVPGPDSSCPAFDRLQGSRMLIGNAEVRFPPMGLFSGESYYGPLPLEIAAFYDTGVAWTSAVDAELFGGRRERVASVGVGARLNFFGYAVLELDLVNPLDRPAKGWHWQFNIIPGF